MMLPQIVYGTDYIKPGLEKTFSFDPRCAAAITPGKKQSLRRKLDANEDCLAVFPLNAREELLLVADSHYGSLASASCVNLFREWLSTNDEPMQRRLLRVHFLLDTYIRNTKKLPEHRSQIDCSTTLISVILDGETLTYANTGDSRLWLVRDGQLRDLINQEETLPLFLGDDRVHLYQMTAGLERLGIIDAVTEPEGVIEVLLRLHEISRLVRHGGGRDQVSLRVREIEAITALSFPIALDSLLESWHPLHMETQLKLPQTGSYSLRPGDVLMLASDGIDEAESGCTQGEIARLLSEAKQPLEKRAAKLLSNCMGRNGGNDNIAFILAEI